MRRYILSLDQGTTSSRAIIFDHTGKQLAIEQQEFTQIYPFAGGVEHDATEIWSTQLKVAESVIAKAGLKSQDIAAIGITNQRETTVLWDKFTGEPIHHAIVWQDRRTASFCDQLKADHQEGMIRAKTGLMIDAYFSASKIKWILDHVQGARENAKNLLFGTIDTWLIWKLTKGKVHVTDVSNASRTMLFNIHTQQWDEDLIQLFDIPKHILPEVKSSSEHYGDVELDGALAAIPIAGIAGDQQAALFGQLCTEVGMVKNTYGTGCFMLMNIGSAPVLSQNNLITTIAWKINGQITYALEGSIFIGGAVVQWLRDELHIISNSSEIEALATKVEDNGGVYFVPAFAGLGAPHWNQYAKGTIFGLTRGSSDGHIARAAVESIAYQTMDVLHAMQADSKVKITELRVDGGATANNLLMQFQANILGVNVIRPVITETTAIGAAYLAGLGIGFWDSIDDIRRQWQMQQNFDPQENSKISVMVNQWHKAVKAVKVWTEL
jgi:glycerol kinase